MRKQRKIKKEDIGDPSNFVHIKHVGFGPRMAPLQTQESFDSPLDGDCAPANNGDASPNTPTIDVNDGYSEEAFSKVERRNKGTRLQSQIPRHHRSTTTCIFASEGESLYSNSHRKNSTMENNRDSNGTIPENRPLTKPTFGSLLNLSFLPLGLGKSSSSSKSPSIGKAKRMSLLNLTATNLFAPSPKGKAQYEENHESVHMTGYVRRRSFSKDENTDKGKPVQSRSNDKSTNQQPKPKAQGSTSNQPTRIPLAKLGRSKSTMSDFAMKRPKLRLKIVPPTVPPPVPPVVSPTPVVAIVNNNETESLPSPPPSPIPSPPPSPVPDTLFPVLDQVNDVTLRRTPKSQTRPRIITLPSTSSVDTLEPTSPQYSTPAGGSSPVQNEAFPLSPTMPPLSTPFFPASRSAPGTPPVWPMQPSWPTTISIHSKGKQGTDPIEFSSRDFT